MSASRRREPLPIDAVLPEVTAAIARANAIVLMAPPGSGKTTRVPPALLQSFAADGGGSVVVLEPRRLAARAAAQRVASELGAELGGLVGYQVRGDSRVSKATRIRFVTEGVLVRQMVADPFLEGIAAVCLDEFHERHLEGDLALSMLQEARTTVREDLKLCVMSATLDPDPLIAFLQGAEVVEADGRLHPVDVQHLLRPPAAGDGLEIMVRDAVERALAETDGDVLAFLPGVGEIARSQTALQGLARSRGVAVLPLHGRLDLAEQNRAVRPGDVRKVVLSTNVAESSLTIPGVTAVVDSGLARELRFDRGRGVDVLELGRISVASATQRSGRAGRTGPGRCYRLWSRAEERGMRAHALPDVQRVDLCGPALSVRAFAGRDPVAFDWFEAPPDGALAAADDVLHALGAIDGRSDQLTEFGRALLAMPMHPRLGAVVLAGREFGCEREAATAATLLGEVEQLGRGRRGEGADLHVAVDSFLLAEQRGFPESLCREFGSLPGPARALQKSRDRLLGRGARGSRGSRGGRGGSGSGSGSGGAQSAGHEALTRSLLRGFPDRVVRRTPGDASAAEIRTEIRTGTMVGGRGVTLPKAADGEELLLALRLHEVGRQQRSEANLTVAVTRADLEATAPEQVCSVVVADLEEAKGRVVPVREQRYRDLPLSRARGGGELDAEQVRAALLPVLAADPFRFLGEQKDVQRLLGRIAWLAERLPELELPSLDHRAIAEAAIDLLLGNDLNKLRGARIGELLLARLSQEQQRALKRSAPDRIELPTGRAAVVDYTAEAGPTVAARLQEFFGLPEVARLANGRVPVVLQLLAPNHRPVQVTTDLASFWATVYPQVRKELSRRYPRHSWPEDPLGANPEARPKPRRRR
ncbi:MAG: ATP-dependent RNA helicase [Planctomycetota bacterium]